MIIAVFHVCQVIMRNYYPVFIMRFLMKYHFKKTMPKRVDLSYRIFVLY